MAKQSTGSLFGSPIPTMVLPKLDSNEQEPGIGSLFVVEVASPAVSIQLYRFDVLQRLNANNPYQFERNTPFLRGLRYQRPENTDATTVVPTWLPGQWVCGWRSPMLVFAVKQAIPDGWELDPFS